MMMWKVVSKTEDPARRQTDSSGSNPPSRFSVHSLVGPDNNEMDCLRRQVSTLLSWSLLIGTTNVPKRKIELHKYGCFWTSSMCRKSPPWPWVLPCPGVGLALHGLLLLLVLLCLFDCLAQVANWDKWLFLGERLNIYLYKFAYISYTFYPQPSAILHKYIFHIYVTVSRSLSGSHGANIWKAVGAAFTTFHHQLIIAITHFAFPPNPLNWRKSQKWPIGDNLSIWRLDWVRIF